MSDARSLVEILSKIEIKRVLYGDQDVNASKAEEYPNWAFDCYYFNHDAITIDNWLKALGNRAADSIFRLDSTRKNPFHILFSSSLFKYKDVKSSHAVFTSKKFPVTMGIYRGFNPIAERRKLTENNVNCWVGSKSTIASFAKDVQACVALNQAKLADEVLEVVKVILKHVSDDHLYYLLAAKDNQGATPLYYAFKEANSEHREKLLIPVFERIDKLSLTRQKELFIQNNKDNTSVLSLILKDFHYILSSQLLITYLKNIFKNISILTIQPDFLNILCANPDVNVKEMLKFAREVMGDNDYLQKIVEKDKDGNTPLHVLYQRKLVSQAANINTEEFLENFAKEEKGKCLLATNNMGESLLSFSLVHSTLPELERLLEMIEPEKLCIYQHYQRQRPQLSKQKGAAAKQELGKNISQDQYDALVKTHIAKINPEGLKALLAMFDGFVKAYSVKDDSYDKKVYRFLSAIIALRDGKPLPEFPEELKGVPAGFKSIFASASPFSVVLWKDLAKVTKENIEQFIDFLAGVSSPLDGVARAMFEAWGMIKKQMSDTKSMQNSIILTSQSVFGSSASSSAAPKIKSQEELAQENAGLQGALDVATQRIAQLEALLKQNNIAVPDADVTTLSMKAK